MLTTRKNISRLGTLALAVAAAAVFTTAASAKFDDSRPQGYLGVTQQNATSGGVTPTDLARAVPRESNAPAGVTPTDLARSVAREDGLAPQLSKAPQVSNSETAWNFSLSERDRAIGFGLGLALAVALSLALVMGRNRIRIAHS
jgi:hypothetical protein